MRLILLDCRQQLCEDQKFLSATGLRFVESQATETFDVSTGSGLSVSAKTTERQRHGKQQWYTKKYQELRAYSTEATNPELWGQRGNVFTCGRFRFLVNFTVMLWYQSLNQSVLIWRFWCCHSILWVGEVSQHWPGSDPTGAGAFASLVWNAAFESSSCLCCWAEIVSLEKSLEEQRAINAQLKARNKKLEKEVQDLKHGLESVEERARKELGLIKKGETFYLFVDEKKQNE